MTSVQFHQQWPTSVAILPRPFGCIYLDAQHRHNQMQWLDPLGMQSKKYYLKPLLTKSAVGLVVQVILCRNLIVCKRRSSSRQLVLRVTCFQQVNNSRMLAALNCVRDITHVPGLVTALTVLQVFRLCTTYSVYSHLLFMRILLIHVLQQRCTEDG